jgi:ribosomal-protein-alanine N-acetyltransferase
MFILRDYAKRDFDALFKLDRLCFEPGIAYSRPELSSFIEQRRSTTIVAEWSAPMPGAPDPFAAIGITEEPAAASPAGKAKAAAAARPAIAGYITYHFHREGYGHVITIDVHPEARRHHLGTLLMEAAGQRLRQLTAFMMVLEVASNNHGALAFYEKLGFKRVKVLERYYNRDLDAIQMTKRL